MTLKLALAACLGLGACAQTPDSLVAINYEIGSTITTAPSTQPASSANAKASPVPTKIAKARIRIHDSSPKIITYVAYSVTYQYPDGTSQTMRGGINFEQETMNALHLTEMFDPRTGRNGEAFQALGPNHDKVADVNIKADAGIPAVTTRPELVIFEDRTWVGDPVLAQRVFSSRQEMADDYAYILGIVREAKASANPIAVYQGYLDQWKAIGWTATSVPAKGVVHRNANVPLRIQQYIDAEKAGNEADFILLRTDEAEKSFYAEHAKPVPAIPMAAKGAK
jgi:hypothetical protein